MLYCDTVKTSITSLLKTRIKPLSIDTSEYKQNSSFYVTEEEKKTEEDEVRKIKKLLPYHAVSLK